MTKQTNIATQGTARCASSVAACFGSLPAMLPAEGTAWPDTHLIRVSA